MITVLFTMKHDRCKVFVPAICTMVSMHLLSVCFGTVIQLLVPQNAIVYFSVFLFLFFGIWMIYEAYHLHPKNSEEKVAELEHTLLNKPVAADAACKASSSVPSVDDPEAVAGSSTLSPSKKVEPRLEMTPGTSPQSPSKMSLLPEEEKKLQEQEAAKQNKLFCCTNPYLHLVVLLFLADWGDRCQISAIVLTASYNIYGVALGGAMVRVAERSSLGHGHLRVPRCVRRRLPR